MYIDMNIDMDMDMDIDTDMGMDRYIGMDMYMDVVTDTDINPVCGHWYGYYSPILKGVTLPLRNKLLFTVTINDFVTFKKTVTSNCDGAITVKMGNGLEIASYFYP